MGPKARAGAWRISAVLVAVVSGCLSSTTIATGISLTVEAQAVPDTTTVSAQTSYDTASGATVIKDPSGTTIVHPGPTNPGAYSHTASVGIPPGNNRVNGIPYSASSQGTVDMYDGTIHVGSEGVGSGGGFAD